MKKSIKIILLVFGIWIAIFLTDFICVKTINRPIFMIRTAIYKDGGTKIYHGLGYKVIDYNIIDGDSSIHMGTYFMKYNPTKIITLTDATKFSKEYTSVDVTNVFLYRNIEEIINILNHGTGVVYLGFPECPWCKAYVPYLNEVAKTTGVTEIYYLNILEDRKNNTEEYKQIVSIISNYLQYDNEGNKRIYVPAVIAINNGEIVGFDDETSFDTHNLDDPKLYWVEEEVNELKAKLTEMLKKTLDNTCTSCNK